MIKNYFKTAWRNLINDKVFSALNILGLAAGMEVALLIGLWVHNEYSYNVFLPHAEQLYQVQLNATNNGELCTFNSTSLALADGLRSEVHHNDLNRFRTCVGIQIKSDKIHEF
jgi:hypothetical protein